MPDAVEFRCPHRGHTFPTREERIAARRERHKVPARTKWKPVQDVRMGDLGVIELYDVGTSYALVTCPVCGDRIRVVTDQEVAR